MQAAELAEWPAVVPASDQTSTLLVALGVSEPPRALPLRARNVWPLVATGLQQSARIRQARGSVTALVLQPVFPVQARVPVSVPQLSQALRPVSRLARVLILRPVLQRSVH